MDEMGLLKLLGTTPASHGRASARFRGRRFELFRRLTAGMARPLRVLDVGGTEQYWIRMGVTESSEFQVTLLNIEALPTSICGFRSIAGDACEIDSGLAGDYDLVYSNSVIEHVFSLERQQAMAAGIRRLGLPYWLQTPNYWFPIEPHFHWLGWQWYPRWLRLAMIQRVRCGMRGPVGSPDEAAALVDEVRLMNASELQSCFPEATLYRERLGPFTKSLVVYSGFSVV